MSVNKNTSNNSNEGNKTTEAFSDDEEKFSSEDTYTESAELLSTSSAVEGLLPDKQQSEPHANMGAQPDDCCTPKRSCKVQRRRPKCAPKCRPKRRATCRPKCPRKCPPSMRRCKPKCRPRRKRCPSRR